MKPKAMFTVKHRCDPKLAVVVAYNQESGRKGKILVSESIRTDFNQVDLTAAAKRLVSQVPDYEVILPIGVGI